jgi:hypothetical protein
MTTLTRASSEWSARPADERFASLPALHDAVTAHRKAAGIARVPFGSLHAKAVDGEVMLNGRTDTTADLTHWAFGQLAQRAGAPASYLATLPAPWPLTVSMRDSPNAQATATRPTTP